MKPHPRTDEQDDLLRPRLTEMIDLRHALAKLEKLIDWEFFETEWASFFPATTGRPATSPRLVAGLLYLQHAYRLSDDAVVARWVENPYYQHFTGETFFQHRPPVDPSCLTRWRQRIGEEGAEWLLTKTIEAGVTSGAVEDCSLARIAVDTTVMEKNIAHPTDARLYEKARRQLVALAHEGEITLRQNYNRLAPRLAMQIGRYAHARQFKRMLNKLVRNWPVAVEGITLVGHSMGGLVSRAVVEALTDDDIILKRAIRDVVCLGSPHAGAPLARLAAAGEQLFSKFELARPIGRVLGVRSRGIRDLDHGLGALQTRDGQEVMFHLIGSTIGDHTSSWLNTTVGDGLVTPDSALADDTGKAQRVTFAQKHHMILLNDPDVFLELKMVLRQHLRPRVGRD